MVWEEELIHSYIDSDPVNFIDPTGLLPSMPWPAGGGQQQNYSPCDYYDSKCTQTGCSYYCILAPLACRYIDLVPTYWGMTGGQINCVRNCLVRRDTEEWEEEGNVDCDGCLKKYTIDRYHVDCFIECDTNSCRYPGINTPFPCQIYDPSPSNTSSRPCGGRPCRR